MMDKAKLVTQDDNVITCVDVGHFEPPADIVSYGDKLFALETGTLEILSDGTHQFTYREATVWVAQGTKLGLAG